MPNMGGLAVLKKAKKLAPLVPFIILTAHGSIPSAVKAIRQGAFHFVLKPIEINELESTIIQAYESAGLQIKLSQSEDRLKMILKSVPDIIYSLDPNGDFLSISPAAEAILGYKPGEFIGKSVFSLIHPDDRDSVIQNLKESIRRKDSKTITHEFRMISSSGEIKHLEIKRKLVFENGKVIRNNGIARDVTERKKLEQNIAERTESLGHANKRLKDKTKQLEYSTIELGKANIELLGAQEQLQIKNQEMETLLTKLSSSRDELQAILDSSLNVIFMVNNSGEIVAANSRITDYFDLELKDVIAKDIFKIQKIINNHFESPKAINEFTKRMHVTSNLDDSEPLIRIGCLSILLK